MGNALATAQAVAIWVIAGIGILTIGTLFLFAMLEHDSHMRARSIRARRTDRREAR